MSIGSTVTVTADVRVSVRGTLPPQASQYAINQEVGRLLATYLSGQGGEVLWPTVVVEVVEA